MRDDTPPHVSRSSSTLLNRAHLPLFVLLLCAACGDSAIEPWQVTSFAAQDSVPQFRTDSTTYSLVTNSVGFEARIRVMFTNRSIRTMYFVNCLGATRISIQHFDGTRWSTFWSPIMAACLSAPITVRPGDTYAFEIRVFAGKPGSKVYPQFESTPDAGLYRVIWNDAYFSYQPRLPWGTPVPESQRVSNAFRLRIEQ
jgi:hypothetical protein